MAIKKTKEELQHLPLTTRLKVVQDKTKCKYITFSENFTIDNDGKVFAISQDVSGFFIEARDNMDSNKQNSKNCVAIKKGTLAYIKYADFMRLDDGEYILVPDDVVSDKYYLIRIEDVLSPKELTYYKVGYNIGRPLYDSLGYHFNDKYDACFADFELETKVTITKLLTEEYVTEFLSIAVKNDGKKEVFWFDNLKY